LIAGWRALVSTSFDRLFEKIRINFLFNHPFLSVLALSLPTRYKTNERSAFETNGFSIAIDKEKLQRYSEEEITYLYAHTLLHIVLKHPHRQKTRERDIWNMSCDMVVNLILQTFSQVGSMPIDEMLDEELQNKCVEEVYEILYKDPEKSKEYTEAKMDLEDGVDFSQEEVDETSLESIIVQALSIAKKSAHTYSGLQIEIDTLLKPDIDLYDVLKEYLVSSFFEKNTTYERPNKRYLSQGIYLPGTKKSKELVEVYIALDSSSSVSLEEYQSFLGVVKDVCEGFYEYKITVLPFDREVKEKYIRSYDSFSPIEASSFHIPKSDGGTDFGAVLRYLKQSSEVRSDSLLMLLSDGEFEMYESLVCQTLFIISESRNIAKFENYGRVIQFNL